MYEYVRKQHAVAEPAERTPFQCISITVEESMRGRGRAPRLRTVRGRAGREAGKGHGRPIRGSMRGRGNALRLRTVEPYNVLSPPLRRFTVTEKVLGHGEAVCLDRDTPNLYHWVPPGQFSALRNALVATAPVSYTHLTLPTN